MNDPALNVFLLCGTDAAGAAAEARKLVLKFAGANPDPFCFEHIREREPAVPAEMLGLTISAVLSPPFIGPRKTVFLQDFRWFDEEGSKDDDTPVALAMRRLAELIRKGLPPDIVLIMNGSGVDRRKGFFRACKEKGSVLVFDKPEITDRKSGEQMRGLIQARARDKGMKLPGFACGHLAEILGTDTAGIDAELEKIFCATNGKPETITANTLQELCCGDGEVSPWALTETIGERRLGATMQALQIILGQEKDPDSRAHGLILQTAGFFRELLQMRVFMQDRRLRSPQQVQAVVQNLADDERAAAKTAGYAFVTIHTYRVLKLAENCQRYSGQELTKAVIRCRDACRQAVSGGGLVPTRLILERLLAATMGKAQG